MCIRDRFTVGRDGSHDIVIMVDKPTHVVLSKKELTGSRELPGNHMAVLDEDGKVCLLYTSILSLIPQATTWRKQKLHLQSGL